jgi:DNA-binding IclR family transcriptional regulator
MRQIRVGGHAARRGAGVAVAVADAAWRVIVMVLVIGPRTRFREPVVSVEWAFGTRLQDAAGWLTTGRVRA